MVPCVSNDESQQWIHTKQGRLIHKVTNKCLDAGRGQSMEDLHVGPCILDDNSARLEWGSRQKPRHRQRVVHQCQS